MSYASQALRKPFLSPSLSSNPFSSKCIGVAEKDSSGACKQAHRKLLIIILFASLFTGFLPKSAAQPSADLLLARMGMQLIDTFSRPVKILSWETRDSLFSPYQLLLRESSLEYSKLSTDSLVRNLTTLWVYSDSVANAQQEIYLQVSDTILRAQYDELKPLVFRKVLSSDKPFFFPQSLLPAAGMSLALLLVSGMFYFRSR
jgi:hypothetical protein